MLTNLYHGASMSTFEESGKALLRLRVEGVGCRIHAGCGVKGVGCGE
jgi:hypothetical protein